MEFKKVICENTESNIINIMWEMNKQDIKGNVTKDYISIDKKGKAYYSNASYSLINDGYKEIFYDTIDNEWKYVNNTLNVTMQIADEQVTKTVEVIDTANIKEGTIVKAIRKKDNFKCQAKYFGYCNGKHIVDFNGTHAMLVDEVEHISLLTKKEAKQKVSELFGRNKTLQSQQIRDIKDLIDVK